MSPGGTRAVLHLQARDIDEGHASIDIGCELTLADIELLMETLHAISIAVREEEASA
jgi:hypothetical protein